MVELGAIRIFPLPWEASAKRTRLPFLLAGGPLRGVNPHSCIEPVMMVDNRQTAETTALPGVDRLESGLSLIVRSRGAVARIACTKPVMKVDNRQTKKRRLSTVLAGAIPARPDGTGRGAAARTACIMLGGASGRSTNGE